MAEAMELSQEHKGILNRLEKLFANGNISPEAVQQIEAILGQEEAILSNKTDTWGYTKTVVWSVWTILSETKSDPEAFFRIDNVKELIEKQYVGVELYGTREKPWHFILMNSTKRNLLLDQYIAIAKEIRDSNKVMLIYSVPDDEKYSTFVLRIADKRVDNRSWSHSTIALRFGKSLERDFLKIISNTDSAKSLFEAIASTYEWPSGLPWATHKIEKTVNANWSAIGEITDILPLGTTNIY